MSITKALVGGLILGFVAAVLMGQAANAPKSLESRVEALETRVSKLEQRGLTTAESEPSQGVLGATDLAQYLGDADAQVFAHDGQFLGNLASKYDDKSVGNDYGSHGSKYADASMWNEYGSYGGKYSDQSPFNSFSANPPQLTVKGKFVAHVTVNTTLSPRIHPSVLRAAVRGE